MVVEVIEFLMENTFSIRSLNHRRRLCNGLAEPTKGFDPAPCLKAPVTCSIVIQRCDNLQSSSSS